MRHIGESPIAVVAIERERALLAVMSRPIHAIDQQDVLPAIAVVIEKGAAGAECLREKLAAEGTAAVTKANPRGTGHVGQAEGELLRIGSPQRFREQARGTRHPRHPQEKRPAVHGMFTSPFRMA